MHKFAAHTIDFHDDHRLLSTTGIEPPDFVKKAAPVSADDVPMDRWAVVLVTPERTFTKFALHNKAYTWLSAHLFPKTAALLPTRARQIAAHFIKRACLEYRMPYPAELDRASDCVDKIASNVLDMSEYRDQTALDYDKYRIGWLGEIPAEVLQHKLSELLNKDQGGLLSPEEIGHELASRLYSDAMNEGYSLPSADTLASVASKLLPPGVDKGTFKDVFVARVEQMEAAEKIKRASLEARKTGYVQEAFGVTVKTAEDKTVGRFQLNSPELLKRAQDYFLDNYLAMHPKYRKELADSIIKQAFEQGAMVKEAKVKAYGGDTYSNNLAINVLSRIPLLKGSEEELTKAASTLRSLLAASEMLSPSKFASVLEEYDKRTGLDEAWDRHVKDPWLSTFETTKVATWSYRMGDDVIDEHQLREFVSGHLGMLTGYLQNHLIAELQRHPVEIFDSLPKPEKDIIIFKMQEAGVAG